MAASFHCPQENSSVLFPAFFMFKVVSEFIPHELAGCVNCPRTDGFVGGDFPCHIVFIEFEAAGMSLAHEPY